MKAANIQSVNKIAELKNELNSFSHVATRAAQTMRSHIRQQYSKIQQIRQQLQQESERAYEMYKSLKEQVQDAYDCGDHEGCQYLKDERAKARNEMQAIQSKLKKVKNVCYKAESWVKSFSEKSEEFQRLAGNRTHNAIGFLETVVKIVHEYASVNYRIGEPGSGDGRQLQSSQTIPSPSSVKTDFSKEASVLGNKILIQNTVIENNKGKKLVSFSVTEEGKGCLTVSYDTESKEATLGDIKTPSANALFPEKEKGILSETEKALKSYGCCRIVHQASPDRESFFRSCGYTVDSKSNAGDINLIKEL
jgi:hypothetical protein